MRSYNLEALHTSNQKMHLYLGKTDCWLFVLSDLTVDGLQVKLKFHLARKSQILGFSSEALLGTRIWLPKKRPLNIYKMKVSSIILYYLWMYCHLVGFALPNRKHIFKNKLYFLRGTSTLRSHGRAWGGIFSSSIQTHRLQSHFP